LTNSGDSPLSSKARVTVDAALVAFALAVLVAGAAAWFFTHGYLLYYGDAQAHLNSSRSILDSRTPGYDQLGTVWLPALHLLCLPFASNDWLWTTGLAGTIPIAFCFVVAGTFFYLAARHAYGNATSALVVVAAFALNPNVLYLASIPMTEVLFLAALAVALYALLRFREKPNRSTMWLAIAASWIMSMTRYDGWFLIPFLALAFALSAPQRGWRMFILFSFLASLAPLYWLIHNWWETGNALDFYNGPFSAAAIQGSQPYPGFHNWPLALRHLFEAGRLCSGWPLLLCGMLGLFCAAFQKRLLPLGLLLLTPLFYIWSLHSSGLPIFVPTLPPHSYYNTRYGISLIVPAAFALGALVLALPVQRRRLGFALPILCTLPWLWRPSPENWICWKESQVNSESRRAWTRAGANFLQAHYRPGQGILTGYGDVPGIFCRAGLPLRETLNIGNGPDWFAATSRPDLFHPNLWAIAQAGDFVSKVLQHTPASAYRLVESIPVAGAPNLEIYRRTEPDSAFK
jgi:hypothetical protein